MATSQFTFYYSSDGSAPVIDGLTGSLLNTLNKCLVTGYGSKVGCGWTKPFEDTGSVGCFMQGAALTASVNNAVLHVMDNGPGAGVGRDARLTGWDTITEILNGNATGSNQWPTATQLAIGNGAIVARKSTAASAVTRNWIVAADSRSVYMFVQSEGTALYYAWTFGDIYSYKSEEQGPDSYPQVIIGKITENSATVASERLDQQNQIDTVITGHFGSRTFSGLGPSITLTKAGDLGKAGGATAVLLGTVTFPNGPDGSTYLSRVWVGQNVDSVLRGHMRGFWHWCHPIAAVSDLAPFSGSGTLAGRTFLPIKSSANAGVYIMETSNTIETR